MNDQNNNPQDAISQTSQNQPSSNSPQSSDPSAPVTGVMPPAKVKMDTQGSTPAQTEIEDNPAVKTIPQVDVSSLDPAELNPVTGEPVTQVPQEASDSLQDNDNPQPESPLDNLAAVTPQSPPITTTSLIQDDSTLEQDMKPTDPMVKQPVSENELSSLGSKNDAANLGAVPAQNDSSHPIPHPLPSATAMTLDSNTSAKLPTPSTPTNQETDLTSSSTPPIQTNQPSTSQSSQSQDEIVTPSDQAQPSNSSGNSGLNNNDNDEDNDPNDQSGQQGGQSSPSGSPSSSDSSGAGPNQLSPTTHPDNSGSVQTSDVHKGAGKYSVKVIGDKCIGAASCVAIAPKAFKLDDNQIAQVLETVRDESDENLLLAAQSCPVLAIEVHDTQTGQRIWPN